MIPIPESVAAAAVKLTPEQKWEVKRQAYQNRSRPFKRAPIWYKLLKNPLNLDKYGLFKDYMRAFNDESDLMKQVVDDIEGLSYIWYKLLKNPLALDKHGLFKDYMRAFNDVSDVVDYEKPNKYNFKLTGVK
jgi:cell fate (sporulation/competence/biofilm development) regulator YmcA (YheA/YmcA/DUF963 family)